MILFFVSCLPGWALVWLPIPLPFAEEAGTSGTGVPVLAEPGGMFSSSEKKAVQPNASAVRSF